MRLLIYAMQSSGASTLAMLLAQKPECSAFVDIWATYAAPSLPGDYDVVAKVVVTTAFPLSLHQERFRPDRTILFLRHPEVNWRSLEQKGYRHHCGFMEEKFAVLDRVFAAKDGFDAVWYYEDMILNPRGLQDASKQLGWRVDGRFPRFRRRHTEITSLNERRYPDLAGRLDYGMGNHRLGKLLPALANLADLPTAGNECCAACPAVTEHYRALLRQHGQGKWSVPESNLPEVVE
jgi:hypothetical protein